LTEMPRIERTAETIWEGNLARGAGAMSAGSGAFSQLGYSLPTRIGQPEGKTSPEELLAAAHAGCFAMQLSLGLSTAGHPPERLETSARVAFQAPEGITGIRLSVTGRVPGIDAAAFAAAVEDARANCPVSRALAAVPISVEATLQ